MVYLPQQRLTSLDAFRGLAIAAMILVNNPGSWSHVYPPLRHAEWHGCTPTDLVFPCFLFIVGTAMAFSLAKYEQPDGKLDQQMTQQMMPQMMQRILRRAALLVLLGVLLNASSLVLDGLLNGKPIDLGTLRLPGVLQRIGLAYLLASIVILRVPKTKRWTLAEIALAGYWGLMVLVPVPGHGAGDLSPEGNLAAYLDRLLLTPAHLYLGGSYDPEGLLATVTATVTVLLGYFTGEWLRGRSPNSNTSIQLVLAGLSCLVAGRVWAVWFPLNKALWTSSYTVFTAGWALLLLAACYEAIEVRGWRRWSLPFQAMGLNAIFLFVASGIVARILNKTQIGTGEAAVSAYTWLYERGFQSWAGDINGSLLFALVTLGVWTAIAWVLYRHRWFFKI